MPQMTIRCPLGELDLPNQPRSEPDAVHLFTCECPLSSLLLRQVSESAPCRCFNFAPDLGSQSFPFGSCFTDRAYIGLKNCSPTRARIDFLVVSSGNLSSLPTAGGLFRMSGRGSTESDSGHPPRRFQHLVHKHGAIIARLGY